MLLQMLVVMMLVLAVVMPRRHGSQVLPAAPHDGPHRRARLMDLWIFCHLNDVFHRWLSALAAWIFAGRAAPTRGEVVGGIATFRIGIVPHATRWTARNVAVSGPPSFQRD